LHGHFKDIWRFHWRPGLLPKPGRQQSADPKESTASSLPPDHYAYGHLISILRYLYFLLDFIVGYWLLIWPKRLRHWLIIGERWHYDVLINPVRYGFRVPKWMLKTGSYLIKAPDLTILLIAEPSEIHARKPELTVDQIAEQLLSMQELLPPPPKGLIVSTSLPLEDSLAAFTTAVLEAVSDGGNNTSTICTSNVLDMQKPAAQPRPRKVLVSAYACEPDKGSEPGVGWHWVEQIARDNEVWVITRKNNQKSLENELRTRPIPNLHFVYVDLPRALSFWKRGPRGIRTYYYLWQFAAFFKARKLHRLVGFDIGHHVTFVNDWLWSFFALMPIPYVWGPIGSHPPCPNALVPHGKARMQEWIRLSIQRTARFIDPLYWLTVARADVVIPGNREVATRFQLRLLAAGRCVVESGIGIEDIPSTADSQRKNNVILYVGRFHYVKCPHIVIQAFYELIKSVPDAILIMIGSGPEEKSLRDKVKALGLEDRVKFPGWKNRAEVLEYMKSSSMFLFPSTEGAGMVVLEAMACGLPVVCLDFGGPADMVENGCGIRIPLGSADEIVAGLGKALTTLCTNDDLRSRMAAEARRVARERYMWENKRRVLSIIYERVLKQGKA
jgi:glycosyltransferase involved in cell wall biosynthesis